MREIWLKRFPSTAHGTLGKLFLPSGRELCTVEPPWQNNQPNISCIPKGRYRVRRDQLGRHRYYQVVDVPGRSAIELHPANYFINPNTGKQELEGCIAPGLAFNPTATAGVIQSRDACDVLLDEMGNEDFYLTITHFDP